MSRYFWLHTKEALSLIDECASVNYRGNHMMQKMEKWGVLGIVLISIVTRVIPHIPNFSLEIVLAFYLGSKLPRFAALGWIMVMAVASDVLISLAQGYAPFGLWSVFSYSALLAIGYSGLWCRDHYGSRFVTGSAVVTLGFWVWTNLGTFLIGGLYPHTAAGLGACYVMALPFLGASVISGLLCCAVIVFYEQRVRCLKH